MLEQRLETQTAAHAIRSIDDKVGELRYLKKLRNGAIVLYLCSAGSAFGAVATYAFGRFGDWSNDIIRRSPTSGAHTIDVSFFYIMAGVMSVLTAATLAAAIKTHIDYRRYSKDL